MTRAAAHILRAALAAAIVLLAAAPDAAAQTGSLYKDPTEVLKKYLTLDSRGARLEALTSEAERPYVVWKEEPAWGHTVVIKSFTILSDVKDWEVRANLDVVIPVDFDVIGRVYWEQATFLAEPTIERVGFHIKNVNGLWRIVEPLVPPHVEQKRMTNFVRQALLAETNPQRQGRLTELRDDVGKAR
jgi:hypothetical protein